MPSEDPFLNRLWNDTAQKEKEGEKENGEVNIYLGLRVAVHKDPVLQKLLEEVEKSSIKYAIAFNEHNLAKKEKQDPKEIENKNKLRRFSHERLIDSLNILSRQCAQRNLDNNWRNGIGLHRDQIGMWGRKVADFLLRKEVNNSDDF